MTEREIARSIDSDSGKTLRIVEVTGEYPGFRIQQLYEGVVQSQSHWDQRSFVDTVEEAQEEVRLIHLAAVEMRSLTREYIRFGYPAPNTPDGPSDYGHKYAEGLIKYNTPGHGYLWLSEELNAQIHPAWRVANGFYEEDQMWTVVAQHFPQYFTTLDRRDARRTLIHWMPHEFMTVTGETIDIKDSYQLQEEAFREATKDKWVSISASSRPQGMVEVIATMGGNRWPHKEASKERRFLVPAVEYAGATRLGFVVDPAMHQEVLSDGVQIAARHSQRISHIKSESLSVW